MAVTTRRKPRDERTADNERQLLLFDSAAVIPEFADMKIDRVQEAYRCWRLERRTIGKTRVVTESDRSKVEKLFSAGKDACKVLKSLFNPADLKAPEAAMDAITRLWENPIYTLAHPVPGVRLIEVSHLPDFLQRMQLLQLDLQRAASALREQLPAIIQARKAALGDLFNLADYQSLDLAHIYRCELRPYSQEVPSYLKQLNPSLYAAELARIRAELQAVVVRREQELAEMLFEVVDNLTERLKPDAETGRKKVFTGRRVSSVFLALELAEKQLAQTGIGRGEVERAFRALRNAVGNTTPEELEQELRSGPAFRLAMVEKLAAVRDTVLGLAVVQPRRAVLRARSVSINT